MADHEPTEAQSADPLLTQYLAQRGGPCPICRYDLRGVTKARCPECGNQIILTIQTPQRSQAWFASGLVGLAVGLGFHLSILGWAAFAFLMQDFGPDSGDVIPNMALAPVFALAIWAWTRWWRLLANSRIWERAALIALNWALSAASVIWFFWQVR